MKIFKAWAVSITIASLTMLLSGCLVRFNPAETQFLLNKPLSLNSPQFLCEDRLSGNLPTGTLEQFKVAPPGFPFNHLAADRFYTNLPSFEQYEQHPNKWRNWVGKRSQQYYNIESRIVGILPAGTQYHYTAIYMPENLSEALPSATIVIDSGPFKGISANYLVGAYEIFRHLQRQRANNKASFLSALSVLRTTK